MFFMGSSKFINQEINMYYLVIVIAAWQHISPEVSVKVFK